MNWITNHVELSSLIYSIYEIAMSINEAFAHIRKESLDIYNRLKSIEQDIQWIKQVGSAYPDFPILRTPTCSQRTKSRWLKWISQLEMRRLVYRSFYRMLSLVWLEYNSNLYFIGCPRLLQVYRWYAKHAALDSHLHFAGHTGNWGFSLRRPNLHLLAYKGCLSSTLDLLYLIPSKNHPSRLYKIRKTYAGCVFKDSS